MKFLIKYYRYCDVRKIGKMENIQIALTEGLFQSQIDPTKDQQLINQLEELIYAKIAQSPLKGKESDIILVPKEFTSSSFAIKCPSSDVDPVKLLVEASLHELTPERVISGGQYFEIAEATQVLVRQKLRVSVYEADICQTNTSAVICPINDHLEHKSGVAGTYD